jgi:hypothetical protein
MNIPHHIPFHVPETTLAHARQFAWGTLLLGLAGTSAYLLCSEMAMLDQGTLYMLP